MKFRQRLMRKPNNETREVVEKQSLFSFQVRKNYKVYYEKEVRHEGGRGEVVPTGGG